MLTTKYSPRAELQPLEHVGRGDAGPVGVQHFAHRRAGEVNSPRMDALGQQIAAGVLGVHQVEVADVVDDAAVDFLGHVEVERAVAGFHVVDRNLHPPGHDAGERAVRVAEDEHGVGPLAVEHVFDLTSTSPRIGRATPG